jgi:hypothetical protein
MVLRHPSLLDDVHKVDLEFPPDFRQSVAIVASCFDAVVASIYDRTEVLMLQLVSCFFESLTVPLLTLVSALYHTIRFSLIFITW